MIFTDKMLPPIFPSQIHIQPDIKIPILQSHQQQTQMIAHSQNHSPSQQANIQHHAQEVLINASTTPQGSAEHYITVSHASHLPHVSNLSRHINAR